MSEVSVNTNAPKTPAPSVETGGVIANAEKNNALFTPTPSVETGGSIASNSSSSSSSGGGTNYVC